MMFKTRWRMRTSLVAIAIASIFVVETIFHNQVEEIQCQTAVVRSDPRQQSISSWLQSRKVIYSKRQNLVFSTCSTRQRGLGFISYVQNISDLDYDKSASQFQIAHSAGLMACLINKVASSSLLKSILAINGVNVKNVSSPHAYRFLYRAKSPEEFDLALSSYFKVMIVREPMERLFSCYLDKVIHNEHKSLKKFRKMILKKSGRSNESLEKDIPTFGEFLEFILDDLSGKKFSSHWVPYHTQCKPCHIHYDVIGKLETAEDDFTYLWKSTGIDKKIPFFWENRNSHSQTIRIMRKNLAQLPRELLLRVFKAYKMDYDLFGYDFNRILVFAGHKPVD